MQNLSHAKTGNRLLDAMPHQSLERLRPLLEPVELVLGEPVPQDGHVYFPLEGMISVVATMENGAAIEIGIVGREGVYSVSAILGDDTPFQNAMVQLPGRALRLKADLLRQEMRAEDGLQMLLLRYAQATMSAVAQSAACNRLHLLEQRCARWLLSSHDRADGDKFPLTQEFLAEMMGVRRTSVSLVANTLQQAGLIKYRRGHIRVLDVEGLQDSACECYATVKNHADRLLKAPSHPQAERLARG